MLKRLSPTRLIISLLISTLLLGCDNTLPPVERKDASTLPDSTHGSDAADDTSPPKIDHGVSPDAKAASWAQVDKTLKDAFAQGKIQGDFALLEIFDSSGQKIHSVGAGAVPDHDEPFPVASASKWVSSTVFLSLVQKGVMSLDDTTGKVLAWTEPELKKITLRDLLSFRSGLDAHLCTHIAKTTLAACAEKIHQRGLESGATVGKVFHYGSQHMTVAAAMAEKLTGKTWKELFTTHVAKVAGFTASDAYYTSPAQKEGESNPLIAGGLIISINDYERFLSSLQGLGAPRLINTSLFAEQHREQWPPDLTVLSSPNPGIHYALGCWRECATPKDIKACDADLLVHSVGAFGFVPFIDTKNHFYGVLAARASSVGSKAGPASLAVTNSLRPMIAAAMAN